MTVDSCIDALIFVTATLWNEAKSNVYDLPSINNTDNQYDESIIKGGKSGYTKFGRYTIFC